MSISRHPTAFLPIPNFQSRIMKSLIVHFCRLITLYLGSCTCIRKYFKKINQIEIHDLELWIGFSWMLWTNQWASNPLSVSTKTPFTIPQNTDDGRVMSTYFENSLRSISQFYIQLLYRSHFGPWLLPFGLLGSKREISETTEFLLR